MKMKLNYSIRYILVLSIFSSCTTSKQRKTAIHNWVANTRDGLPVYVVINAAYNSENITKVLVSNEELYHCGYEAHTVFDENFADTLQNILRRRIWRPTWRVYQQLRPFGIDTAIYNKLKRNYTTETVYSTYFNTQTQEPDDHFPRPELNAAIAFLIEHYYFAYRECYSGYLLVSPP